MILRSLRKFIALFPSPVPTGIESFNVWAESFYDIYDMPTEDRPSVKFALATMIMHAGPTDAYKSKRYFYLALKASAAKQVAAAVFQEIKLSQQAAAKEASSGQTSA